ncbi:MAG: hypothetical protein E6I87_11555 [Chloroflexi bacterium]|nr:MAG: hypothetical protein E6I87_11555 [Chloroflexota bacterium]
MVEDQADVVDESGVVAMPSVQANELKIVCARSRVEGQTEILITSASWLERAERDAVEPYGEVLCSENVRPLGCAKRQCVYARYESTDRLPHFTRLLEKSDLGTFGS